MLLCYSYLLYCGNATDFSNIAKNKMCFVMYIATAPMPTPNMKDLMGDLMEVANSWKHIGIYLHLPMSTLKSIAVKEYDDPSRCLSEMLQAWLIRPSPSPTWPAIIEAVEFLEEKRLAKLLKIKYCS